MYVLGLSGGFDTIKDRKFYAPITGLSHDSSAVLLKDGVVVAAVEEERFDRIKHSNLFPSKAVQFCLTTASITIDDVDCVAYYLEEEFLDNFLNRHYLRSNKNYKKLNARQLIAERLGSPNLENKIHFVNHHYSHVYSSLPFSGYNDSLVLAIDGLGESTSGLIGSYRDGQFVPISNITSDNSLGMFYVSVIKHLGFDVFEEYKVMGLAPYGDHQRFESQFFDLIELHKDGAYSIVNVDKIYETLLKILPVRKKWDPLEQIHKDLAATLQASIEKIVLHILKYWRNVTKHSTLCISGGVAQNCSLNGKILNSGLFDSVFVPPAAHDSGCALGAAAYVTISSGQSISETSLLSPYLGHDINQEDIPQILGNWSEYLTFSHHDDISSVAANLIADGKVIGWVQGKSEFGPRALGNRSIIADPRPYMNRERINRMIKKREGFRPFAPSVLNHSAGNYFKLNMDENFEFMTFIVDVKDDYRDKLGAITHVDGTARIQTVDRDSNLLYWSLIKEFGNLTGVDVILNTSFNNSVEPIVNTVEDTIVCFLTTELDYLVVGSYVVSRKSKSFFQILLKCKLKLPEYSKVYESIFQKETTANIVNIIDGRNCLISEQIYHVLKNCISINDTISNAFEQLSVPEEHHESILLEILSLWELRLISINLR
ncbi:carbamoyltransferase [Microbulbifer sp. CnH-101-G]|uniref:carbamoyltransferase family protein n=1 Tax=Microbulbifer sp. CnH-101-G TaxID=3243393 RepID=UPI004039EE08